MNAGAPGTGAPGTGRPAPDDGHRYEGDYSGRDVPKGEGKMAPTLTMGQTEQFVERGYLSGLEVFSSSEMDLSLIHI